jgi:DNA gyrase subunit A
MNLGPKTGLLVSSSGVNDFDEIIVITAKGRLIRVAASQLPILSRTAMGSILVRLDEGDSVAGASIVSSSVCEGQ